MADQSHATPEVEMRHILDPLDEKFQGLAPHATVPAEVPRETVPEAVSGATGTVPVCGYQLTV